ncbi:unnamed protein product [Alopecurus aequalis]
MAEIVASVLVQEGVSGVFSLAASHHEEKVSQGHLLERLEMAQSQLEFSLERSSKMPISDVSLLRRRMMLKCAFNECTLLLHKHKHELPGDEEAEPRSSIRRKIMHAVQHSVWYFSSPKKDVLARSEVRRFEWFAEKAGEFIRDVESDCSLARHRFSNPIVTQLLEGKLLGYSSEHGKKKYFIRIGAVRTEEHGVMAWLMFEYRDLEATMNFVSLKLGLRLSESTDIVGIGTKCLQSLGPSFKGLSQVAMGELAHLSTQVHVSNQNSDYHLRNEFVGLCRPDPLCCTRGGLNKSGTSNNISSELSGRFPEQVAFLYFRCNISVADYNLRSSTRQVKRKTKKAWPYLELHVLFAPHATWEGAQVSTLHRIEETIHTEANYFFSCQPKLKEYEAWWWSTHGAALFWVVKPIVHMRCEPRTICDGSMTRRVHKRAAANCRPVY